MYWLLGFVVVCLILVLFCVMNSGDMTKGGNGQPKP